MGVGIGSILPEQFATVGSVDEIKPYSVVYIGQYGWSKSVYDRKKEAELLYAKLIQDKDAICVALYGPLGIETFTINAA